MSAKRTAAIALAAAGVGLAGAALLDARGVLGGSASSSPGDTTRSTQEHLALLERRLGHPWPPAKGLRYPDVELRRLDGTPIRFSSLFGKVLLVEPVGMPCPASLAYNGAEAGPFRGVRPQEGVPSVAELLAEHQVDPAHPDLLHVHLLLYGTGSAAPSLEDARAWAAHFQLQDRPNTLVLVGDERLVDRTTYAMIPGFQLVGRDGLLLLDGTGHRPLDHPYDAIFPALRDRLDPPPEVDEPHPPPAEATPGPDLTELLRQRAFDRLEATLADRRAQGRLPGDFESALERAVDTLARHLPERPQLLDGADEVTSTADGTARRAA